MSSENLRRLLTGSFRPGNVFEAKKGCSVDPQPGSSAPG